MEYKKIQYDSQRLMIENHGKGKIQVVIEYYNNGELAHADLICNGSVPVEIITDGEFKKKALVHLYPKY
jgi:hypothetical protein